MPVSGFPNQTAYALFSFSILVFDIDLWTGFSANQVDEMGKPYLTNIDFLKNGVPASIIATAVRGFILTRLKIYLFIFIPRLYRLLVSCLCLQLGESELYFSHE